MLLGLILYIIDKLGFDAQRLLHIEELQSINHKLPYACPLLNATTGVGILNPSFHQHRITVIIFGGVLIISIHHIYYILW
jgi:hypothetical protein